MTSILPNSVGPDAGIHARIPIDCLQKRWGSHNSPQPTELHVRVALLNRFTHLGTPLTVAVA